MGADQRQRFSVEQSVDDEQLAGKSRPGDLTDAPGEKQTSAVQQRDVHTAPIGRVPVNVVVVGGSCEHQVPEDALVLDFGQQQQVGVQFVDHPGDVSDFEPVALAVPLPGASRRVVAVVDQPVGDRVVQRLGIVARDADAGTGGMQPSERAEHPYQ